jgi:hypothetical protein
MPLIPQAGPAPDLAALVGGLDRFQQQPAAPPRTVPGGRPELAHLQNAVAEIEQYQQKDPDPADKAWAADVLKQIHAQIAKEQGEMDNALTKGQLTPSLVRKLGVQ